VEKANNNACLLVCLTLVGLLLSSCTSGQKYQYDRIRTDYAALTCNAPSAADSAIPKDVGCTINRPLDLQEAIAIARANNPDVLMTAARIQKARALLEKAKAPFYPYVGVYTEYLQGDAPSAYLFKTIDQRQLAPDTNFNDPGWFENYETGVQAGINLYNGGRDNLQKKIAETEIAVSGFDRQSIENQLIATVTTAYYDALAARAFIETAQDSVNTVEAQLRIMKVRFEAGGALKSDILSLEVRLAQAKEHLVRSQNQYQVALAALANVLGINLDVSFTVQDDPDQALEIPDQYPAGLEHAMEHRPELFKVREQVRQSRMAIDRSRSGYLPRVDFQTRYYVADPDLAYDLDRDNWTAGIMINWDLFTGFSTAADRDEAEASLAEIMAADRKTLLAVRFDVKRAYLNLFEAEERLKVAQSSVAKAEESFYLVKQQYQGGSANITRYLEAQLAANQACINAIAAFYDRQKAMAEIGRAIGYWSATDNTQKETRKP
jgi:outer membrane protein TolC